MDDHSKQGADQQKQQDREKTHARIVGKDREDVGIAADIGDGVLEELQANKQHREPDHEIAPVLVLFFLQQRQQEPQAYQRQRHGTDAHLEAEDGDQPGGDRGTDIRPHDHADGLPQGQQTGVGETDDHQGGRRGRLDHGGDGEAREHGEKAIGGGSRQDTSHALARQFQQGVAHDFHPVEEQAQCPQQGQDIGDTVVQSVPPAKSPAVETADAGS